MKSKFEQSSAHDDAALDTKALDAIGQALKAHYDDLVFAPMPDKFTELLARLEAEEKRAVGKGDRDAS
jgi:Anti-sigma factor NepR